MLRLNMRRLLLVVALAIALAHCWAPLWDAEASDEPFPPYPQNVAQYGCRLEEKGGQFGVGWYVYVWANYSRKSLDDADRDWGPTWYSFRKDDEKAHKDCRDWRRKLKKKIEEARRGRGDSGP